MNILLQFIKSKIKAVTYMYVPRSLSDVLTLLRESFVMWNWKLVRVNYFIYSDHLNSDNWPIFLSLAITEPNKMFSVLSVCHFLFTPPTPTKKIIMVRVVFGFPLIKKNNRVSFVVTFSWTEVKQPREHQTNLTCHRISVTTPLLLFQSTFNNLFLFIFPFHFDDPLVRCGFYTRSKFFYQDTKPSSSVDFFVDVNKNKFQVHTLHFKKKIITK